MPKQHVSALILAARAGNAAAHSILVSLRQPLDDNGYCFEGNGAEAMKWCWLPGKGAAPRPSKLAESTRRDGYAGRLYKTLALVPPAMIHLRGIPGTSPLGDDRVSSY